MIEIFILYAVLSKVFAVISLSALILTIYYPLLEIYELVIIHCLLVGTLFAINKKVLADDRDLPFYMALFLPGIGVVVLSMMDMFAKRSLDKSEQLDEYERYIAYIDRLMMLGKVEVDVTKQVNIMSGMDEMTHSLGARKKEMIISLMTDEIDLKVKILKKALYDDDPEIVHYASTVLLFIEESYEKMILELREKYQRRQDVEMLMKLVAAYDKYLESGLLEGDLLHIYLNEYLELLLKNEELISDNYEVLLKIVATRIRLKKISEATELLQRLYQEFPDRVATYVMDMRLHYDIHNYPEVVKRAVQIKYLGLVVPGEYQSVVDYWAQYKEIA